MHPELKAVFVMNSRLGKKKAGLVALVAVGALTLAGCSSSDEEATPTPTPTPTATSTPEPTDPAVTPEPTEDLVLPDPKPDEFQMLPPNIVTADQTEVSVTVGDQLVIAVDDPVNTTISVDNTEVLMFGQGRDDGDAIFNPGAVALSSGTATITVTNPDGSIRDIAVTVSPQSESSNEGAIPGVTEPTADQFAFTADLRVSNLALEDAAELITANNYTYRVGVIDGEPQALTMDFDINRITLVTEDGIVVGAGWG